MIPPSQALVDAVALAIARTDEVADCAARSITYRHRALAAIAAVQANETCAQCGAALVPPTMCAQCAADKTPAVVTARRAVRGGPADAQLEVGAVTTRINRSGVSPNMGQPGEVRSCPPGLGDCTSPTPGMTAERSSTFAAPEYTNDVRPLSRPLVIGVPLSPERIAQLNYAAGAGDDPAGSPDVSREPKSPLERKPAGISSEVAAKTSCQPPASNRAVGVLGMSGGEPDCGAIFPKRSIKRLTVIIDGRALTVEELARYEARP